MATRNPENDAARHMEEMAEGARLVVGPRHLAALQRIHRECPPDVRSSRKVEVVPRNRRLRKK